MSYRAFTERKARTSDAWVGKRGERLRRRV